MVLDSRGSKKSSLWLRSEGGFPPLPAPQATPALPLQAPTEGLTFHSDLQGSGSAQAALPRPRLAHTPQPIITVFQTQLQPRELCPRLPLAAVSDIRRPAG